MRAYLVMYRLPVGTLMGYLYESREKAEIMAEVIAESMGYKVAIQPYEIPEGF